MKKYDAIIIGAGQAGIPLARKLGKAGMRTAIIEQRLIGGTCINDGCTPTKTMIASAKMAWQAANSEKWGLKVEKYAVNMQAVLQRKNEIVERFRNGATRSLQKVENIDIIFGAASFSAKKVVEIRLNDGGTETLTAEYIFIDTGTTTRIPEIEGLDAIPYLTSTSILDLDVIPEQLLIIGAGYIAMELGQMFRRFGSRVTMLEHGPGILAKEDEDVTEAITELLRDEGITILLEAKTKKVRQIAGVGFTLTADVAGEVMSIDCSHILVAPGRRPQTPDLSLDKAGIETNEKGYIKVNDQLETNVPGVYALGEVNGGPAFTHIAYNDHLIVYKNIVGGEHRSVKDRPLPYCMYIDPQFARVGITEKEARDKGLNIKVAKQPMTHVARAIETGEDRGMMKAIVDADTKKILGASILAVEGGEIMSVLQMAMMGGMTYDEVRECVFAHPTLAESLNNLFMMLDR